MQIINPARKRNYKADGLTVSLNAGDFTNLLLKRAFEHLIQSMYSGMEPSGTLKPQPKRRTGGARGVTQYRKFVDSLSTRKARGKRRAKAAITYNSFFSPWLRKEKRRGVEHIGVPDSLVDEVVAEYLKGAIK